MKRYDPYGNLKHRAKPGETPCGNCKFYSDTPFHTCFKCLEAKSACEPSDLICGGFLEHGLITDDDFNSEETDVEFVNQVRDNVKAAFKKVIQASEAKLKKINRIIARMRPVVKAAVRYEQIEQGRVMGDYLGACDELRRVTVEYRRSMKRGRK